MTQPPPSTRATLACIWSQTHMHHPHNLCLSHTHTHILHVLTLLHVHTHTFTQCALTPVTLRHCSSGAAAAAQAGGAALARKAGCRGDRGGRLVGAAVLQEDVGTLLTSCITRQREGRLPLGVPTPHITAILQPGREGGE